MAEHKASHTAVRRLYGITPVHGHKDVEEVGVKPLWKRLMALSTNAGEGNIVLDRLAQKGLAYAVNPERVELGLTPLGVTLAAAAGSFLGDAALYEVARRMGRDGLLAGQLPRMLGRLPDDAIAAVRRRPLLALTVYRFVPGLGKYAPLAAGAAGIGRTQALLLCALGSAGYCIAFAALGVALQPAAVKVLQDSRTAWAAASVLLGILACVLLLRAGRRGAAAASKDTPPPPGRMP